MAADKREVPPRIRQQSECNPKTSIRYCGEKSKNKPQGKMSNNKLTIIIDWKRLTRSLTEDNFSCSNKIKKIKRP